MIWYGKNHVKLKKNRVIFRCICEENVKKFTVRINLLKKHWKCVLNLVCEVRSHDGCFIMPPCHIFYFDKYETLTEILNDEKLSKSGTKKN